MKILLILLLAFLLPSGNCAEQAKLNPDHAVFLERLAKLSDDSAGKLWPGFKLLSDPLLIYFEEDGQSLLVGHPKPPAGFSEVPGKGSVYYSASFPKQLNGSFVTQHPIGGIPTNIFALPRAYKTVEGIATMAHEVFHTYQRKHFREYRGQYCEAGAEPLALMFMENYIAAKMLLFPADAGLTRDFLAIRERKYELAPNCVNEDLREVTEGTAKYVEMRSLGLKSAKPAAAGDNLSQIRDHAFVPDGVRHARAYNNGAALCFALEGKVPGWEKEIENGRGQWELLKGKLGTSKDMAALYKKYDFEGFLRRAQEDSRRAARGREALLKEIGSYAGYKVRLIPFREEVSVNYNADSTKRAGKYAVLELKTVSLTGACETLRAANTRLVEDGRPGFVLQVGAVPPNITVDGKLVRPDSGYSHKAGKTEIKGKDFSLSIACGAAITVKGREITVEVTKDAR